MANPVSLVAEAIAGGAGAKAAGVATAAAGAAASTVTNAATSAAAALARQLVRLGKVARWRQRRQ